MAHSNAEFDTLTVGYLEQRTDHGKHVERIAKVVEKQSYSSTSTRTSAGLDLSWSPSQDLVDEIAKVRSSLAADPLVGPFVAPRQSTPVTLAVAGHKIFAGRSDCYTNGNITLEDAVLAASAALRRIYLDLIGSAKLHMLGAQEEPPVINAPPPAYDAITSSTRPSSSQSEPVNKYFMQNWDDYAEMFHPRVIQALVRGNINPAAGTKDGPAGQAPMSMSNIRDLNDSPIVAIGGIQYRSVFVPAHRAAPLTGPDDDGKNTKHARANSYSNVGSDVDGELVKVTPYITLMTLAKFSLNGSVVAETGGLTFVRQPPAMGSSAETEGPRVPSADFFIGKPVVSHEDGLKALALADMASASHCSSGCAQIPAALPFDRVCELIAAVTAGNKRNGPTGKAIFETERMTARSIHGRGVHHALNSSQPSYTATVFRYPDSTVSTRGTGSIVAMHYYCNEHNHSFEVPVVTGILAKPQTRPGLENSIKRERERRVKDTKDHDRSKACMWCGAITCGVLLSPCILVGKLLECVCTPCAICCVLASMD